MAEIKITFPDGSSKDFQKGTTGLKIAESIGPRLAQAALAIRVNDELYDLFREIDCDAKVEILTFDAEEGKHVFWHSTAHVLAQAVLSIWPDAKPTIGPTIESGFYYDFDSEPFSTDDLIKIEKKMQEIVQKDYQVERKVVSVDEAAKIFKHNKYKLELIKEFSKRDEILTLYSQGSFSDLCRGGHVLSTGKIKSFKLTKVSSAYWRGDQKRESLQRIYGVSFPKANQLKEYLHKVNEAKKRDHRKIGREMDLFSVHQAAPGMPFFHDKGIFMFNSLANFMRQEMEKLNYKFHKTPVILSKNLWLQSGHWDHYKDNMYYTRIEDCDYAIKPMNCPGNLLIFSNRPHSYRELPIKAGEFGLVHRHELSGVLSGLFRVRVFTQDDAHIFCTKEQLQDQIAELLELVHIIYSTFGFHYEVELSTMPDKAMGDPDLWHIAENILTEALISRKIKYKLNPGDGAFYGPKIDFHIKDAIGRTWQCGTIQLDFSMPEKFDLTYEGADGKKHRPVMLHRAIYGSFERFIGVLIEHYAGKFPLWLNPNQVILLPIADRHAKYCAEVAAEMKAAGLRTDINLSAETTNKKIREAQLMHYNYILVVGDKEVENKTVNVRTRDEKVHGEKKVKILITELTDEIKEKS